MQIYTYEYEYIYLTGRDFYSYTASDHSISIAKEFTLCISTYICIVISEDGNDAEVKEVNICIHRHDIYICICTNMYI